MASAPDLPQRIVRLTPIGDVLASIDARVRPVAPVAATLPVALGRTLAEDIVIGAPVPAVALALRDGWAVKSELTTDAGAHAPAPLVAAVRIDAGQPLPADTDAVAPLDAVTIRDGAAQALAPAGPGEGVLQSGDDVARGAILLPAGRRLGRLQIALIGVAGVTRVRIRAPRLRVLRARPQRDTMLDAVVETIAGVIESEGGIAVAQDRGGRLDQALRAGGDDAAIVVGGTGSGRDDATVHALASAGEVLVHGVGIVPGETTAFGMASGRPVLALPGRFDAALAAWHLLGRRVLALLAATVEPVPMRPAKLTHKVTSTVGLAELVPVCCDNRFATPIASDYFPLSALAQANGWILVKPESEGYPAHSEVMVRPWP